MNVWYQSLERPPLTPPDAVFGPVWTLLYAMIALALVLAFQRCPVERRLRLGLITAFHLIANAIWTPLFFAWRQPGWALLDILLLNLTLWYLLVAFRRIRPLSAYLLLPYAFWILFATYLNLGFWVLNRN